VDRESVGNRVGRELAWNGTRLHVLSAWSGLRLLGMAGGRGGGYFHAGGTGGEKTAKKCKGRGVERRGAPISFLL
jgi:hypothetical protein